MGSITHTTSAAALDPGERIGATDWDDEHAFNLAIADISGLQTSLDGKALATDIPRVLVETFTATGAEASKTFSSLGSYTDLEFVFECRGDTAATNVLMGLQFNGDTGGNYDRERLNGVGDTTQGVGDRAQTQGSVGPIPASTAPSGEAGKGRLWIPGYRGTAFNKSAISHLSSKFSTAADGDLYTQQVSSWWRNSAAITSVTFLLAAGNFASGSTIRLYGWR